MSTKIISITYHPLHGIIGLDDYGQLMYKPEGLAWNEWKRLR